MSKTTKEIIINVIFYNDKGLYQLWTKDKRTLSRIETDLWYSQEEYDNKSISWDKVDSIESAEGKLINIKVLQQLQKELKDIIWDSSFKDETYMIAVRKDIDSVFAKYLPQTL